MAAKRLWHGASVILGPRAHLPCVCWGAAARLSAPLGPSTVLATSEGQMCRDGCAFPLTESAGFPRTASYFREAHVPGFPAASPAHRPQFGAWGLVSLRVCPAGAPLPGPFL